MYIDAMPPEDNDGPGPIVTTKNHMGRELLDCWFCHGKRKSPAVHVNIDKGSVPICRDCYADRAVPERGGNNGPTLRVGDDCPLDIEPGDYS